MILFALLIATEFDNWVKMLESKNAADRRIAIENLGNSRNLQAYPYLVKALDDKDAYVRKAAAMYCGVLRISESKDKLVKLALNDVDAEVRQSASVAIGYFGDSEIVMKITPAFKDKEKMVAAAAINTAGIVYCKECVRDLATVLDSNDVDLKRSAASALVRIATLEAAKESYSRIPVEVDTITLSELLKVIGEAQYIEGKNMLYKFIDDSRPIIKAASAYSLSKFNDSLALKTARDVVKLGDEASSILAISVIASMGDDSDIKLLDEVAKKAPINVKNAIEFAKMRINSRIKK